MTDPSRREFMCASAAIFAGGMNSRDHKGQREAAMARRSFSTYARSDLVSRWGSVRIACDFYRRFPDELAEAFAVARFLPLRIEDCPELHQLKLTGFCHLFQPLAEGHEAPEYVFNIKTNNGAIESVTAEMWKPAQPAPPAPPALGSVRDEEQQRTLEELARIVGVKK